MEQIKLSENQLRGIIAESVKKVLAEDYYDDWRKKYEKKPRKGFDSDSVHSTIKMMTPQCQNPRKGFDSDSVHKVIKGMMKEGDDTLDWDYAAPYLQLDKQQMSDPFGWLQSQGSVNVRAILKQMNLDERMIDCLLRNYCPDESKAQAFANYRQNIGRKAIQAYKKWQWDNELKEGKQTVKLNESQLRQIVAESVRRVLKEANEDNPKESAYRLTVMLGEIIREIESGGELCSLDELNELYGYACSVNDYFERI